MNKQNQLKSRTLWLKYPPLGRSKCFWYTGLQPPKSRVQPLPRNTHTRHGVTSTKRFSKHPHGHSFTIPFTRRGHCFHISARCRLHFHKEATAVSVDVASRGTQRGGGARLQTFSLGAQSLLEFSGDMWASSQKDPRRGAPYDGGRQEGKGKKG